jgi:three-Cys-motif partner protein
MGSVSSNEDTRTLDLFNFDAPPINDGIVELTFKSGKQDGYPVWTENKAKLIQQYVRYFILVTKHGTYIDGFAGPQVEEYNDDSWSAKRVLEIRPAWLRRFILCDMKPAQVEHLTRLVAERRALKDKRKIEVHQGDFNALVDKVCQAGSIRGKEATFCLLDQRTFECKWETVRRIAQCKTEGTKIEQFYFLAVGWLGRSMAALKDDQVLRDWWGRDDVSLPKSTTNSVELARLFSHRFVKELRYATAAAWPIYERVDSGLGKIMYFMIHATDHPEAPKLMNRAYKAATLAQAPMDHSQSSFEGDGFDLAIDDKEGAAQR